MMIALVWLLASIPSSLIRPAQRPIPSARILAPVPWILALSNGGRRATSPGTHATFFLLMLVKLILNLFEDSTIAQFLQECFALELVVVGLLEGEDGKHLEEGDIQVLVLVVKLKPLWDRLELLEILPLAQEQLDRVQRLQKQMLILLVVLQYPNE